MSDLLHTARDACSAEKIEYTACLKGAGFIGRMMGACDELQKKYEACMDGQFEIRRKANLAEGRARNDKWQQDLKDLGLK